MSCSLALTEIIGGIFLHVIYVQQETVVIGFWVFTLKKNGQGDLNG